MQKYAKVQLCIQALNLSLSTRNKSQTLIYKPYPANEVLVIPEVDARL